MTRLTARRLLVVALICGKLALGSAMPLPMLMSPASHCASQQDSMSGMAMPDMSMLPAAACHAAPGAPNAADGAAPGKQPAACCKSGACALLQAPALAFVIPTLALRLQIAAQPGQPRPPAAVAAPSAPFRPPI